MPVTRGVLETESPGNTRKQTFMRRLCQLEHERWFVEGFLAIYLCERQRQSEEGARPGREVKLTHDQLQNVVATRFEQKFPIWKNPQIHRLKEKYVTRLGTDRQLKPATVFELFREIEKGKRASGATKGSPSVYEATGAETLLLLSLDPLAPTRWSADEGRKRMFSTT